MGIFLIGVCNMIGGLSANLIGRLKAQLGNSCLFGNLCAIFLGVVFIILLIRAFLERSDSVGKIKSRDRNKLERVALERFGAEL